MTDCSGPSEAENRLLNRFHIALSDLHAKALLVCRTNAAIENVQREHVFALRRHVAKTPLHVGEGISLYQHLHDVTMVQGNGNGADRGDECGDGDD